ncbi:MAG: hypothetical protein HKN20_06560 [Gemmatimonadetes bacterium]|nr:hypothetical protein [Gemmatimonadota bacterium]
MGTKRSLWVAMGSVAGILAMSGSAFAFAPVPEVQSLEIRLPQEERAPLWESRDMQAERSKAPGAEGFLTRYGGSWQVQRNEATGTAHMVFGSGVALTAGIASEAAVESEARRFFNDNTDLFMTRDQDLVLASTHNALGKWSAVFNQEHEGIPVYGGRAHAVFTETGRLFVAGSDFYPEIEISTTPQLTAAQAELIAGNAIGFNNTIDTNEGASLQILPIEANGAVTYHLVWDVRQRVDTPRGIWSTMIDAQDGAILRRENLMRFLTDVHVHGEAFDPHYCGNSLVDKDLQLHEVDFGGTVVTTDENGDAQITVGSPTPWTAALEGPWADIIHFTAADPELTGTLQPTDTTLDIDWNNSNAQADEVTCFYFTNIVHEYLRDLDPGPGLDDIDYQMPVTISRNDGFCPGNAWYDYNGINFCSASATYGNTGELSDVVHHEFGHGITHRIYNSQSSPPSDLHEGNSDVIANLLTNESIIGLGFFLNNCTGGIRDSDNSLQYPGDWTGAIHFSGQILAGVVWDAWQELQLTNTAQDAFDIIGNVWHHGRSMTLPTNQPDQVLSMLIADDDDGNLTNGTPNWTEICIGASNHGHDCSALVGLSPEIATAPASFTVNTSVGGTELRDLYISNIGTGPLTYDLAGVAAPFTIVDPSVYAGIERGTTGPNADVYANVDATRAMWESRNGFSKTAATIFTDDMESGVNGWSTALLDGSTDDLWHQQTTNSNSPSTAWWCGILAGADYATGNRISNTLESPSVLLTGSAPLTFSFYESYTTESGWDFVNVDIQDSSGSWTALRSGVSGSSGGWQQTSFDVSSYAGQTVKFRFHFDTTDGSFNNFAGWFIDDVTVSADGVDWLSLAPVSGTVAPAETDTVTVTFDATALAPGTYNANVRITSNDATDPLLLVPATLNVTGISVSADSSFVTATDSAFMTPDGLADTMTVTVTVRDGSGAPIQGIAAGDISFSIAGASLSGGDMQFCSLGLNNIVIAGTDSTDSNGQSSVTLHNVGGCGTLAISATVSSTAIPADVILVRSADINGDGEVNFLDTFIYLPELNVGTGNCGNFDNDPASDVNFFDTLLYLPHLSSGAKCP